LPDGIGKLLSATKSTIGDTPVPLFRARGDPMVKMRDAAERARHDTD
jgi:hypothetical protein